MYVVNGLYIRLTRASVMGSRHFFAWGGMVSVGYLKFFGVFLWGICICMCMCVRVCVCACMRMRVYACNNFCRCRRADIQSTIKEKNAKGIEARSTPYTWYPFNVI